jgi:hypothetical protein
LPGQAYAIEKYGQVVEDIATNESPRLVNQQKAAFEGAGEEDKINVHIGCDTDAAIKSLKLVSFLKINGYAQLLDERLRQQGNICSGIQKHGDLRNNQAGSRVAEVYNCPWSRRVKQFGIVFGTSVAVLNHFLLEIDRLHWVSEARTDDHLGGTRSRRIRDDDIHFGVFRKLDTGRQLNLAIFDEALNCRDAHDDTDLVNTPASTGIVPLHPPRIEQ